MERAASLAFADQFRNAREAALKDAEAFDEIIHVIERLGSFLTKKPNGNLRIYKTEIAKLASKAGTPQRTQDCFRALMTPFSPLYDLVQDGRNDAMHQGAFARHLTTHAIELAIILEDALRCFESPRVCDYMVRNPVCAELWQPIGFVRQQMLAGSFSFLPVLSEAGQWCVISDCAIAIFLGTELDKRKERMALTLSAAQEKLNPAEMVSEETSFEDALARLKDAPLLVYSAVDPKRLLGIVTAFDLL